MHRSKCVLFDHLGDIPPTGRSVEVDVIHVLRSRDGKHKLMMLEQLGFARRSRWQGKQGVVEVACLGRDDGSPAISSARPRDRDRHLSAGKQRMMTITWPLVSVVAHGSAVGPWTVLRFDPRFRLLFGRAMC